MPDLNSTSLVTFKNWTLRIRESMHQTPRLLLLIHGHTGDENSMWVFARAMPDHYWMIAPRAPYAAESGGYSWRPPQTGKYDQLSLEMLEFTAEMLIRLVDEYSASAEIDAGVFDVMGFSQGAAVSSLLAFLYPMRVRKTGLLAGFIPSGLEELVTQRPLEGKQFFVAHGARDETVPVGRARASIALLEQAGGHVAYCEDQVGHKVSVTCLRALQKFFAD
jgi:phospholipase/carboxylesterase